MTQLVTFCPYMSLLDQSGVTGGGLDPYNVHALFVNMDNMWTERFGNYDCLVIGTYLANKLQNPQVEHEGLIQ